MNVRHGQISWLMSDLGTHLKCAENHLGMAWLNAAERRGMYSNASSRSVVGRPYADTLKGSKHANMKGLRFDAADGEWRAAFAFGPQRKAILLVAGDKSGGGQKRFYKQLIATADRRFSAHFGKIKGRDEEGKVRWAGT